MPNSRSAISRARYLLQTLSRICRAADDSSLSVHLCPGRLQPPKFKFSSTSDSKHYTARFNKTRATSAFHLPQSLPFQGTPITIPTDPLITQDELLSFRPFITWLTTLSQSLALQSQPTHPLHTSPYHLRSITIQSIDLFGGKRLGFLKFTAEITNDNNEKLPSVVFMRGGSVAIIIVLTPSDPEHISQGVGKDKEEYVILTVQPRIAAGSLSFVELSAGMLDDAGTFAGAAAKEIQEETGLEIREEELIDLTQLSCGGLSKEEGDNGTEQHLHKAMYLSPRGSDEFMPIMMLRKKMESKEIEGLKGRLTGLRGIGEKITLRVVSLRDVWRVAGRDGKTLAAVALLEGLRREGKI